MFFLSDDESLQLLRRFILVTGWLMDFNPGVGVSVMPLPSMKDQFAALTAAPSVSCTQAHLDQSNRPVIDLLATCPATWLAQDIQQVSPGKFNLLATFGTGPGGLVLAGHSDERCPSTVCCGRPTRSSSPKSMAVGSAWAAAT